MPNDLREYLLGDLSNVDLQIPGSSNQPDIPQLDLNPDAVNLKIEALKTAMNDKQKNKRVRILSSIPTLEQDSPSVTLHAANQFSKSFVGGAIDMADQMAEILLQGTNAIINSDNPKKRSLISDNLTKKFAERDISRDKVLDKFFRSSKKYQNNFLLTDLPQAFGSMAMFMASGLITGGAGSGAAISGALSEARSQATEAYQMSGGNIAKTQLTQALGALIGTSEGIPVSHMFTKAEKLIGKTVKDKALKSILSKVFSKGFLKEGVYEGGEEFIQESLQTIAENKTAQQIYDDSRKWYEGALRGGSAGFISGFALQMLFGAAHMKFNRKTNPTKDDIALDKDITTFEKKIEDTILKAYKTDPKETPKEKQDKNDEAVIATNTDQLYTSLFGMNNVEDLQLKDNEKPITEDNTKSNKDRVDAAFPEHVQQVMEETKNTPDNLLHTVLRLNKNISQDFANGESDDNTKYEIKGLSGEQIGGLDPTQVEELTNKIKNKVLAIATKNGIDKSLELPNGLPVEIADEYKLAAALDLKSNALALIQARHPEMDFTTATEAENAVKSFQSSLKTNDTSIQAASAVAMHETILDETKNITSLVKDNQAKDNFVKEASMEGATPVSFTPDQISSEPINPYEDIPMPSDEDVYRMSSPEQQQTDKNTLLFEKDQNIANSNWPLKKIISGGQYEQFQFKLLETSPKTSVIKQKFIKRSDLKNNPNKVYLFGDNLQQTGLGGQAKAMRGESNAIGIPTKKVPSNAKGSFFSDSEFETNKRAIDKAFEKVYDAIKKGKSVVIPEDGLGTGRASLKERAPKTYAYLQEKLGTLTNTPISKESATSGLSDPLEGKPEVTYGDALNEFKGSTVQELYDYYNDNGIPDSGVDALTKALLKIHGNTPVIIEDLGSPKNRGYYNTKTGVIVQNTKAILRSPEELRRSLAHELLHAFTHDYLQADTKASKTFRTEIENIMSQAKLAAQNGLIDPKINQILDMGVDEFLAYTFANQGIMREELSKISFNNEKAKDTLWSKFVKSIMEFFKENYHGAKTKTLLDQLTDVMDTYADDITKFHIDKLSNAYVKKTRTMAKDVTDGRLQTIDTAVADIIARTKPFTEETIDNDEATDRNNVQSITDLTATNLGIDPIKYLISLKKKTFTEIQDDWNMADKANNNVITEALSKMWVDSYRGKTPGKFEDFKRQFAINKLVHARSISPKEHISFRIDKNFKVGEGVTHKYTVKNHGTVSFKDPTSGAMRNPYRESYILEEFIPALEKMVGLPEGTLKTTILNDFTLVDTKGNSRSQPISRVTKSFLGLKKEPGPTSALIARMLAQTPDQLGYIHLYMGNFGGNNTLPVIKLHINNGTKFKEGLTKIGEQYGIDPSKATSMSTLLRWMLWDHWTGNLQENGQLQSPKASSINGDMVKLLKRDSRFIHGQHVSIQDGDVLKTLDKDNVKLIPTEDYSNTLYNGVRLDPKTGRLLVNTYILPTDPKTNLRIDFIKAIAAEFDLSDFEASVWLENKFGTDITDGASFYVVGQFGHLIRRVFGSLKEGTVKTVYSSKRGQTPLYIKHASHAVSRNGLLGQWMIKNNIGLLVSESAVKLGKNNHFGKSFETELGQYNYIKEEHDVHKQRGSLKQILGTSAIVKQNKAFAKADPNGTTEKAFRDFMAKAATNVQSAMANLTDEQFFTTVERVIEEPSTYKERKVSDIFRPLFKDISDPIQRRESLMGLVNEPMIAEVLRQQIMKHVALTLESKIKGARVALGPDLGMIDQYQTMVPLIKSVKSRIINYPMDHKIFMAAVPNKEIRAAINGLLYFQKSLQEIKNIENTSDAEIRRTERKIDEFKSKLKEFNPKYTSPTNFVDTNNTIIKKFIGDRLEKAFFIKMVDGKPVGSGRLRNGFVTISQDIAKRHNLRAGDKILIVVTPTDSANGMTAVEIASITPVFGSKKVGDRNKLIANSEYIQSIVGKDFDIDTISIIPYNKSWSSEEWSSILDTFKDLSSNYINQMVFEMNSLFQDRGIWPEGISKVTEDNLQDESTSKAIKVKYAQLMMGENYKFKSNFKPNSPEDFHTVNDMYLTDKSMAIVQRRYHTSLTSIGLSTTINKVKLDIANNPKWNRLHTFHLIWTNDNVDAPATDSLYRYNHDMREPRTWETHFDHMWGIKKGDTRISFEEKQIFEKVYKELFGRATQIAAVKEYGSYEKLDAFTLARAIQEQKVIFDMLETNPSALLDSISEKIIPPWTGAGSTTVIKNRVKEILANLNVKDINNYPLYAMINNLDGYSFPLKGLSYEDYLNIEVNITKSLIKMVPSISEAGKKAAIQLGIKEANTPDKLAQITDQISFYMGENLNIAKRRVLSIVQMQREVNKGGAVALLNTKTRGQVFPQLFRKVLVNSFNKFTGVKEITIKNNTLTLKPDNGQLSFIYKGKKYTSEQVLTKYDTTAEEINKYLLGPYSDKTSLAFHGNDRAKLATFIDLQQNLDVDTRKDLIREEIEKSIYNGNLNRDEEIAFWVTSIVQVANRQTQNLMPSRPTYEVNKPHKFQANSLLKELMSDFEPNMFKWYMQEFSYQAKVLPDSLRSVIPYIAPMGTGDEILYETDIEYNDNFYNTKMHFLHKYINNLKPNEFKIPALFRFNKLLKEKGYAAAYKELQDLANDIATRIAIAEQGVVVADLNKDLKLLTAKQFRNKYNDVQESNLDRAITMAKEAANKDLKDKYDLGNVSDSDQAKNNLESAFWMLHTARKPYLKSSMPTSSKTLNKIIKNIRSFSSTVTQIEVKNFLFKNGADQTIGSIFDPDPDNPKSFKRITLGELKQNTKDYAERVDIGVGEGSLAVYKVEKMSRNLKLFRYRMEGSLDKVSNSLSYTDPAKREKAIVTLSGRQGESHIDKFVYDSLSSYGEDLGDSNTEMRNIYELADGMAKREGIYIGPGIDENQDVLGWWHGNELWKPLDKWTEFIEESIPEATGKTKLRLAAALHIRKLLDVDSRGLIEKARNYLSDMEDNIHKYYNDPETVATIRTILNNFDKYFSSMDSKNSKSNKGKYGNYIPHQFPPHIVELIAKEREITRLKSEYLKQRNHHKDLMVQNDPAANVELATMSDEDIQNQIREEANSVLLKMRLDISANPMNVHFLKQSRGYEQYIIKNDIEIFDTYIDRLINSLSNELTHAEFLLARGRAIKAGNNPAMIEELTTWFADQVGNKFLNSRAYKTEDLKRGSEINFLVQQAGLDRTGSLAIDWHIVSGVLDKADNESVTLHVNHPAVKRESEFKIEKYTEYYNNAMSSDSNGTIDGTAKTFPGAATYWQELVNLAQFGYLNESEFKSIKTRSQLWAGLILANSRVIQDPSKYGVYKRSKIQIQDETGKIIKDGTHLKRFVFRGGLGWWEGMAREMRNVDVIDGVDPEKSSGQRMYNIFKASLHFTVGTKKFMNWMTMGLFPGSPATIVNYMGAFKNNHIDSPRENWKYRKRANIILQRFKSTNIEDLPKNDRVLFDKLLSLGILSRQKIELMDISLSQANVEADKLLLKKKYWATAKELVNATRSAKEYQQYKNNLDIQFKKHLEAVLKNDTSAEISAQKEIARLNSRWAVYVEHNISISKPLSETKEKELLKQLEKDIAAGNLSKTDMAEKYDVTVGQALKLLAKLTSGKIYTSKSLGVGLQATAEVQRGPAYLIGYLKALDYGFSETEADIIGLRNVDRQHALYDNAHKQRGSNTMGGKLMYMYSTYKYNAFRKYMNMWRRAIPQFIKHRSRMTKWSDWPNLYKNVKSFFNKNIELTDDALKDMTYLKRENKVIMKDVNVSNYLMMRTALGAVSAQLSATLLYGLANSDDPVTQALYDLLEMFSKLWDDDDSFYDKNVMWSIQSAVFWAGMPQSLALQVPSTGVFYDWEKAKETFTRGRFGMQREFLLERLPATLKQISGEKLSPDERTLFEIKAIDKLLGIKLFGYSKYNNEWIDGADRIPLALNPFNWIPDPLHIKKAMGL